MKKLLLIVPAIFLAGCRHDAPANTASAGSRDSNLSVDAGAQKETGIKVEAVESRSDGVGVVSTGQLQVNEDRTWHVGAITEGRIVTVSARLGDFVKASQVVARMHSHEVHDSRADRSQALTELARTKLLAEQAARVRDRTRRLFELKAASREQLEAAETQYQSARFAVQTAEAGAEKTKMHLTEFLEVELEDDHAKESSNPDADTVPIRSPESGTVIERQANTGSVVSPGDTVMTVSDLSSLWMIAAVNEADLPGIHQGQAVGVTVRAYPERTFHGKVFRLGEKLDAQTRTLQVRVVVPNPQGLLKPDMFASAVFAPSGGKHALSVPESAVQELNGRSVVFVETQGGQFAAKDIAAGARVGGRIEILSGLEPDARVVTNGALLLKSQLLKRGGA